MFQHKKPSPSSPKLRAAGIVNLEEWPTFYEDMQEDLEQYCSKFGEVLFVGAEKKLGN